MIQAIFIAAKSGAKQSACHQVDVVADKGILGDRNFDQHRFEGQNVTLIASETIAKFNQRYHRNVGLEATRRNIVTKGVNLNHLVGSTFYIGYVKLLGIELCEPCLMISQSLSDKTVNQQQALNAFREKAGIRAKILNDGQLAVGMSINLKK